MPVFHTKTRSPRGITLYKKEISKVRHDLAFLLLHGRPPDLQMVSSSLVIFFLGIHGDQELLSWLLNQIITTAPFPYLARQRCRGNDIYGITGIPSTIGGCGVVRRAGLGAITKIVYPGSGREDA